uniref:Uncharacterized protein n=1 Tax=Hemiselmis andersenii TaxID=464988 RepID=A0A7S0TZ86_HEMAN
MGQALGSGLAGWSKTMDALDDVLDDEDGEGSAKKATPMTKEEKEAKDQKSKEVLFGGREAKIMQAAEKDLDEMEAGDLTRMSDVPIPEPILFNKADFENSVWRVQVEKTGNWFSGNYCPDEFLVALGAEEKVEFAGDPLTGGKWYTDSGSLYIERKPIAALGPFGPGKEYYRMSLTGWATEDMTLQAAGVVSGFSPLFPVAILGRCLATSKKEISAEDLKQKIRASVAKVGGGTSAKALKEGGKKKRVKVLDISDDLTEEEERKKMAAEWMPSTIVDNKKDLSNAAAKVSEQMGGSLERLKDTLEDSVENYKNIKD